jgi:tight adherence protein C
MNSHLATIIEIIGIPNLMLLLVGGGLVMLALFGVLASVIAVVNHEVNPVKDRLEAFKEKGTFQNAKSAKSAFDDLQEQLIKFSEPIAQKLYGQNLKYQKQVKTLMSEAGLPDSEANVARFLAQRAATGLVFAAAGLVAAIIFMKGVLTFCMFGILGGFVMGSMVPQHMLKSRATDRKASIRFTLSDTLDLMVVCVEAGLSLDATFHRIVDDMERMAPEMAYEVRRLNKELSAGLSRQDAFHALGLRTGVEELRSLCTLIIQADRMGTSIAEALRIYSVDMRVRRRQNAEELAAKASTKLTFPLVLFIFPPLLIILMGPVIITAIQNFSQN